MEKYKIKVPFYDCLEITIYVGNFLNYLKEIEGDIDLDTFKELLIEFNKNQDILSYYIKTNDNKYTAWIKDIPDNKIFSQFSSQLVYAIDDIYFDKEDPYPLEDLTETQLRSYATEELISSCFEIFNIKINKND